MRRVLLGIGVGPGDPDLLTVGAIRALKEADLVILPLSKEGAESVAGNIVKQHLSREWTPMVFPMKGREDERDPAIRRQIEDLRPLWEGAGIIAVPVIGDATLYSTVAWLYRQWQTVAPTMELRLMPGISAHALAAARIGRFLAMGEDRLSILPGTASYDDLAQSLLSSDSVALYKLPALGDSLPQLLAETGPWGSVTRIDRAGWPSENIVTGLDATSPCVTYLSILLLHRREGTLP